jgi:nitrogen fixation protein NifQ
MAMHVPPLRSDFADRQIARADEVDDVVALLMAYADPLAGPRAAAQQVALVVAVACLGDDHLWQDLQFDHRGQLNALLHHWFPALVAKNTGDMKWKKFFYRQLCEQAEILICKSPSCAVCTDYVQCFEVPELPTAAPAASGGAGAGLGAT